VGVGALGLFGVMLAMDNGPLMAIPQAAVEPKMQGRVLAVMNAMAMAMSPIGLAVAGPLADAIGPRTWFVIAGLASIGLSLTMLALPAVMHIEDRVTAAQAEPAGAGPEDSSAATVRVAAAQPAVLPTGAFNMRSATVHFTRDEVRALRAAAARKKQQQSG
jgi:MFS family permease